MTVFTTTELTRTERVARALAPYLSAALVVAVIGGAYWLACEHRRADAEPEQHQQPGAQLAPVGPVIERGPYAVEAGSPVEEAVRETLRCRANGGVPFVPITDDPRAPDVVICVGERHAGSLSHPLPRKE